MTTYEIKKLIQQGEGVSVEFKSSSTEISSTTYETVCAIVYQNTHAVINKKNQPIDLDIRILNLIDSISNESLNESEPVNRPVNRPVNGPVPLIDL
jgi:predicted HTH transcriptional regulator